MRWRIYLNLIFLFLFLSGFFTMQVFSQSIADADELKNKIEERNNQIKILEEEIKKYNAEVENANREARTLQNTINSLDLTRKKITTDINLTENKITKTNLTIQQFNEEIKTKELQIDINKQAIKNSLKNIQVLEKNSLINVFLSNRTLSDLLDEISNVNQIRDAIIENSKELSDLKKDLENKQQDLSGQKKELVVLSQDLSGKKQAVDYTVKETSTILNQTKNKEQAFKELVKTKEEEKSQFERELFDYESQLRYIIDPNSYPQAKNGILAWPLDNFFITQRFGRTVGAERLYASGSHNGVDFRASVGTRVKNVLSGVVVGTGNTDQYPGCYSFGKWVMVRHDNGLSTIYAHLSVISVNNGQRLDTGDLIGFSGNTGYSTGPHLHISVYATQGVRIEKYVTSRGCKEAVIPLADVRAYLDPLQYLPTI